jgi:phenylacetic acid degradation operon negative regulatory protein
VFAHPELDPQALLAERSAGGVFAKVVAFDASLGGEDAPQRLVELGWDLEDLGLRYQRFVARFAHVQSELKRRRDIDPRDGFLVRTLLIHEYRRLHLRDPLLPAQLLRPNWPGVQAAQLCRDIYGRVFAASEAYLSRVASRLAGPLPAAESLVLQRFGGIGPLLQRVDDEA